MFKSKIYTAKKQPNAMLQFRSLKSLGVLLVLAICLFTVVYLQSSTPVRDMKSSSMGNALAVPSHSTPSYPYAFDEAKLQCKAKSSVVLTTLDRPTRMFVYPPGADVWISDAAHKSNGNHRFLFEYHLHQSMLEALAGHPGAVVYDIGANIGTHSVLFAAEGYEVHSFEPLKSNFELLDCSAMINQFDPARFRVNNYGLSTEESSSCMGVAERNMGGAWIDSNATCNDPVHLKRLDKYLEEVNRPPYLIKIDVEGHEYNALLPAKEYLRKHRPAHIFTEFSSRMLKEFGKVDPMLYLEFFWDLGYKIKMNGKIVDAELAKEMVESYAKLYDIHAFAI